MCRGSSSREWTLSWTVGLHWNRESSLSTDWGRNPESVRKWEDYSGRSRSAIDWYSSRLISSDHCRTSPGNEDFGWSVSCRIDWCDCVLRIMFPRPVDDWNWSRCRDRVDSDPNRGVAIASRPNEKHRSRSLPDGRTSTTGSPVSSFARRYSTVRDEDWDLWLSNFECSPDCSWWPREWCRRSIHRIPKLTVRDSFPVLGKRCDRSISNDSRTWSNAWCGARWKHWHGCGWWRCRRESARRMPSWRSDARRRQESPKETSEHNERSSNHRHGCRTDTIPAGLSSSLAGEEGGEEHQQRKS